MAQDPSQPTQSQTSSEQEPSEHSQAAQAASEQAAAQEATQAAAQEATQAEARKPARAGEPLNENLARPLSMQVRPRFEPLRPVHVAILAAGVAAVGIAIVVSLASETSAAAKVERQPPAAQHNRAGATAKNKAPAFAMPACTSTGTAEAREVGNPAARRSAQRGLDYLARAASEWQKSNNCYGCHVQAVTVEALAVGIHHQYAVPDADMKTVLRGMLDLPGGAKSAGGLGHPSPSIAQTGKLLGGAAFARYDQWVDASLRDHMLVEAQAMLEMQSTSGQVPMPWASAPVATGPIQATAHAVVAWKQAYERTADDQWLTAISRAEDYLHSVVAGWNQQPPASIQDLNYAVIGLLSAGVASSEDAMVNLARILAARQNQDGGWSLHSGGASEVFATGQSLYVLRLMGQGDGDSTVARGTRWLIAKQQENGSWSGAGFGKAEAMWAVLGLVSIDVLSVSVAGIENGQHVADKHTITVTARDNKGGGVEQIELYVDDLRVHGACGAGMTYEWDTSALEHGKHVVEVRAQNARGEMSRRFVEVYAGNVYLTQIGSRFVAGQTEIALRNIAPADSDNRVAMEVFAGTEKDGRVVAGDKLHAVAQKGRQGAMTFQWNGEGANDRAAGQKYVARLTFTDPSGRAIQTEDVVFVHDTVQAQQDNWAQLEGQLNLPGGDLAQNAEVELVDNEGRVVQRTKSTRQGKYRFRNIEAKQGYKVRVNKKGFRAVAPAAAVQGADNKANLNLVAE